ncbi:Brl1/Brr6 domain-containing protein, partial [Chytridium lagenaria]
PYIFIGYLRLGFTLFVMGMTVFLVVQFVLTVHHDLQMKAEEYSAEITQQVLECNKQYLANKCSPIAERLPAMQVLCNEWELCMSRD